MEECIGRACCADREIKPKGRTRAAAEGGEEVHHRDIRLSLRVYGQQFHSVRISPARTRCEREADDDRSSKFTQVECPCQPCQPPHPRPLTPPFHPFSVSYPASRDNGTASRDPASTGFPHGPLARLPALHNMLLQQVTVLARRGRAPNPSHRQATTHFECCPSQPVTFSDRRPGNEPDTPETPSIRSGFNFSRRFCQGPHVVTFTLSVCVTEALSLQP